MKNILITTGKIGATSGLPAFAEISPETADSLQSFNNSLADWKQRAEALVQSADFQNDVLWLCERTAHEVFDAAQQLRFNRFELIRELIRLNQQRIGMVDVMQVDLEKVQADALRKFVSAQSEAEKKLSKILAHETPRELAQFKLAIQQSEPVKTARAKLNDINGQVSTLAEIRRPLSAVDDALLTMLRETVGGLQ